jgi:hypothetical protein
VSSGLDLQCHQDWTYIGTCNGHNEASGLGGVIRLGLHWTCSGHGTWDLDYH